jgi:hypothetical protein
MTLKESSRPNEGIGFQKVTSSAAPTKFLGGTPVDQQILHDVLSTICHDHCFPNYKVIIDNTYLTKDPCLEDQ